LFTTGALAVIRYAKFHGTEHRPWLAAPLVAAHGRMRAYDRDLIRGGHYGQRSREPRKQAEHMAAPTNAANVKRVLANAEPSTHGTNRTLMMVSLYVRFCPEAEVAVGDIPSTRS
jgi:hypothetical protein